MATEVMWKGSYTVSQSWVQGGLTIMLPAPSLNTRGPVQLPAPMSAPRAF